MRRNHAARLSRVEAAHIRRNRDFGLEFWTVEHGMATNSKTGQALPLDEMRALPGSEAKTRFITIYEDGGDEDAKVVCGTA